tara:strand:+ start:2221 stop:3915 length:1695 start_codon:yes stop_codon:yes gene_type:complete
VKFLLKKKLELIVILFLITYSFSINFYYGFQGFNYVDSFQHIAGGKLVLEGNIPFKDYWMTNSGPMMDFVQSFFFKVAGISWNSLVLNASFFNILFTLNTYFFCKLLNLDNIFKFTLSLCAATIMYPTSGTPLVDYHAIITSMIGLTYFLFFLKKKNYFYLGFTPIFFIIALFFKQVPSFYIALIIFFLSITLYFYQDKKVLYSQIIGSFFAVLFSILFIKFVGIKLIDIYEQYFLMPLFEYNIREKTFDTSFFSTSQKIRYVIFLIIPSIIILYLKLKEKFINKDDRLNLFLLFGLFFTSVIHESYTWNQATTLGFLPFISALIVKLLNDKNKIITYLFYFLSFGLILRLASKDLFYLILLLVPFFIFKTKLNFFKNKVNLLVVLYTLLTTLIYYDKLISTRKWQDIYNPEWKKSYINAALLDKKLKGLRWISNNPNTKEEFLKTKKNLKYIKDSLTNEKFIIITHYQIYNMILGVKNFSPAKYWWADSSYPITNKKLNKKFNNLFINKIKNNDIEKIIVLDDVVIGDFDITNFDWLVKCSSIEKEASSNFRIVYKINKLCLN